MSGDDLSLIETKALIAELNRRFDNGMLVAYSRRTARETLEVTSVWGDRVMLRGMACELTDRVMTFERDEDGNYAL